MKATNYVENPNKELFMLSLSTGIEDENSGNFNDLIDVKKWVRGVDYSKNANSR